MGGQGEAVRGDPETTQAGHKRDTRFPVSGDKDAPPIGLSIDDQRREISERHERSRRLLEAVFDEVVTTQKPGAPNAER